jgi:hypothetical protein
MANMKIVSMVAHEARRVQAETEADIATALAVVEEELIPLQDKVDRLRADVDKLIEAHNSPSSSE